MVASHRRLTKNPAEGRDFKSSQCPKNLSCFLNLPGFNAVCADLNAFYTARSRFHPYILKIGKKTSWNTIMCVADVIACHRFLAAHFTNSCHLQLRSFPNFNVINYKNNITRKHARGKEKFCHLQ
jgi:hypothetical protein